MAYREVVANGDAVMLEVFVEHRIHIIEAILWVLVFIELAYDDALHICKQTSYLHVVQHTVYFAHTLIRILHKLDNVFEQERIEIRASEVVVYRQVSANDDTLCPTLDIQWMRCNMIGGQIALQHTM